MIVEGLIELVADVTITASGRLINRFPKVGRNCLIFAVLLLYLGTILFKVTEHTFFLISVFIFPK